MELVAGWAISYHYLVRGNIRPLTPWETAWGVPLMRPNGPNPGLVFRRPEVKTQFGFPSFGFGIAGGGDSTWSDATSVARLGVRWGRPTAEIRFAHFCLQGRRAFWGGTTFGRGLTPFASHTLSGRGAKAASGAASSLGAKTLTLMLEPNTCVGYLVWFRSKT